MAFQITGERIACEIISSDFMKKKKKNGASNLTWYTEVNFRTLKTLKSKYEEQYF